MDGIWAEPETQWTDLSNHHQPLDASVNTQPSSPIEQLQQENARLKQHQPGALGEASTPATAAPSAAPSAQPLITAYAAPKAGANTHATQAASPSELPAPSPPRADLPLQQYRRPANGPSLLASNSLTTGATTTVNTWITQNIPRSDMPNLDVKIQEIQQALEALDEADRPAINRILVDWGLGTAKVSKRIDDVQLRLLAAI